MVSTASQWPGCILAGSAKVTLDGVQLTLRQGEPLIDICPGVLPNPSPEMTANNPKLKGAGETPVILGTWGGVSEVQPGSTSKSGSNTMATPNFPLPVFFRLVLDER